MRDLVFIVVVVGFFALAVLFVKGLRVDDEPPEQMAGLTVQNFASAPVGIAVAGPAPRHGPGNPERRG